MDDMQLRRDLDSWGGLDGGRARCDVRVQAEDDL